MRAEVVCPIEEHRAERNLSWLDFGPVPDLSKPPLHTLPHDELMAKLKSLTNLRAVRDPASATGWKIELGRFPGWKNLPTW